MPFYQKKGKVPSKRHIQYYKDSGLLYWEELISREGFSGIYSNVKTFFLNPLIKFVVNLNINVS